MRETNYPNTKMCIDGHTWVKCYICGKWHKNDYGFKVDARNRDASFMYRVGMCSKCAKEFINELHNFVMKVDSARGSRDCPETDVQKELDYQWDHSIIGSIRKK